MPRVGPALLLAAIASQGCHRSPVASVATARQAAAVPMAEVAPTWTPLIGEAASAFTVAEVAIDATRVCARATTGTIACWGDQFRMAPDEPGWDVPTATPHRLEAITDARAIVQANGLYILRADETVTFVRDTQMRRIEGLQGVVELERADNAVCARSRDGRVRCMGRPYWVKDDDADEHLYELALPATAGLACDARGCCGWNDRGVATCVGDDPDLGFTAQPRELPISGVTDIAIESSTACATALHGSKCWGRPLSATFGQGWTPPRDAIVRLGRPPCVLASQTLTCGEGQQAWSLADVVAVSRTGGSVSCAVHRSGALSCWGDNANGSLGDGVPVQRDQPNLVEGITATRIFAAWQETCATTPEGATLCWGRGVGRPHDVGTAMEIHVAGQYVAACGIDDGVTCHVAGYGGEYERIEWRFPGRLRAGAIDRASNVCVIDDRGDTHCRFALGEDGTANTLQRLLTPAPVQAIAPMAVGFVLAAADGRVFEWHDPRFAEDPDFVDAPKTEPTAQAVALTDATEITTHQNGGCASTRSGKVMCWGGLGFSYEYAGGRLASVPGLDGAHGLSGNHFHVCGIVDGEVRCFGENERGQLGRSRSGGGDARAERVALPGPATQVVVGDEHTCAIVLDGRVYCWGSDDDGQLGLGRTIHAERPIATVLGPRRAAITRGAR